MHLAILNDKNEPELVQEYSEWATWFEANSERRQIGLDKLDKLSYVSTVFLGLSIETESVLPRFFETQVFGGQFSGEQRYYLTYQQAIDGHVEMVTRLSEQLADQVDDATEQAERFEPTHTPSNDLNER
jgi:hypothetical protein